MTYGPACSGIATAPAREPDTLPTLAESERSLIVRAMRRTIGSKDGAAYLLGIRPSTLYRKIDSYEIRPEEWEKRDR